VRLDIRIQELNKGWLVTIESAKLDYKFACMTRDEVFVLVKDFMEEGS